MRLVSALTWRDEYERCMYGVCYVCRYNLLNWLLPATTTATFLTKVGLSYIIYRHAR